MPPRRPLSPSLSLLPRRPPSLRSALSHRRQPHGLFSFRCAAVALCVAFALQSLAAQGAKLPTVSILYFEDLGAATGPGTGSGGASGADRYLGKAIVELVLADLSAVKGVAFVERGKLEKVLEELELGLSGIVDEDASPKVGELLGARWLVLGSYLSGPRSVDIAFRIVGAEDAVMLKAGRLSGSSEDMGGLVSELAREIAFSLAEAFKGVDVSGLRKAPATAQSPKAVPATAPAIAPPRIPVATVREYGRALDLEDSGKASEAVELLRLLTTTKPGGAALKGALSALEARMRAYDAERARALDAETGPPADYNAYMKATMGLVSAFKMAALLEYCMLARASPPAAPPGSLMSVGELNDYYMIYALQGLKRLPDTIKEGEDFLRRYPTSVYYAAVRGFVRQAADSLREREPKVKRALAAIAELKKNSPGLTTATVAFREAAIWSGEQLWREALDAYMRLDLENPRVESMPGDLVVYMAFMAAYGIPDREAATRILEGMERDWPDSQYLSTLRGILDYMPR